MAVPCRAGRGAGGLMWPCKCKCILGSQRKRQGLPNKSGSGELGGLMDTRIFFCCTTTETPRISSYQSFLAKSCGGSVVDTMQIIKSLETIQEGICYYKNIKKRPHTEDWMGLPENALFKSHT